jgi:hypothetical protein
MRYIKTYEELLPNEIVDIKVNCGKYKVGDYVVIDTDNVIENSEDFFSAFDDENMEKYVYVKITDIISNDEFPLKVYTALGSYTSTNKDEIDRYMTPEEIERYDSEKNAKKYNL